MDFFLSLFCNVFWGLTKTSRIERDSDLRYFCRLCMDVGYFENETGTSRMASSGLNWFSSITFPNGLLYILCISVCFLLNISLLTLDLHSNDKLFSWTLLILLKSFLHLITLSSSLKSCDAHESESAKFVLLLTVFSALFGYNLIDLAFLHSMTEVDAGLG